MLNLSARLRRIEKNLPAPPVEILVILPDDAPDHALGPGRYRAADAPAPQPGERILRIIPPQAPGCPESDDPGH